MKFVVTGAAGFIGSHVCRELLARDHQVRAIIRPGSSRKKIADIEGRLEIREADLFRADQKSLFALACGTEGCIHAAWNVKPGMYLQSKDNLDCLVGSLRWFEQVWKAGCLRIIGIGTCFEYKIQTTAMSESTPTEPVTLYAAAKLSTLLTSTQLARTMGGSFAWARLFYLYGPHENSARLIPDLITHLRAGTRVPMTDGHQRRDFLHVSDAASGIAAIALSDLEGPVNVCTGVGVPVRDIANLVATELGRPDLLGFGQRAPNIQDPPAVIGDASKLRGGTGWSPARSLAEGLRQTINWWKEHA